jgi:thymidylate kinase
VSGADRGDAVAEIEVSGPAEIFGVALIGPDGAGKTTVARQLERVLPMPAKYLYMGVNWDASNHLLPTTRVVQAIRRARGREPGPGGPAPIAWPEPPRATRGLRFLRATWTAFSLLNRLAEEWYRQVLAWGYMRRGTIVIFDRHFFSDYYAHDVAGGTARTFERRIHGFLLAHVYPKPDLVVYLDAPPELLLARKGEGTLESLERRRKDYLSLKTQIPHFAVVDATRSVDEVTADIAETIRVFAVSRSLAGSTAAGRTEESD